MKYTVCYAKYGSQEIEADTPNEAVDKLDPEKEGCIDDWEVTLVVDENGREVHY